MTDDALAQLGALRDLGAETVVFDPYHGNPEETRNPRAALRDLAVIINAWQ